MSGKSNSCQEMAENLPKVREWSRKNLLWKTVLQSWVALWLPYLLLVVGCSQWTFCRICNDICRVLVALTIICAHDVGYVSKCGAKSRQENVREFFIAWWVVTLLGCKMTGLLNVVWNLWQGMSFSVHKTTGLCQVIGSESSGWIGPHAGCRAYGNGPFIH